MGSVVGTGLFNLIRVAICDGDLVKVQRFLEENPKYQKWENIKDLDVFEFKSEDPRDYWEYKFSTIVEFLDEEDGKKVLSEIFLRYNWPYPIVDKISSLFELNDLDFLKHLLICNPFELNFKNTFKILYSLLAYQTDLIKRIEFFLDRGLNLNIVDDRGEPVILELFATSDYCDHLDDLVKLGMDPTMIGKTTGKDIIDILEIEKALSFRFMKPKIKAKIIEKVRQIINEWEAKKFVPLKTECSKVFSLLVTKKIIQNSIHRKADFNKVWKVISKEANFVNHGI